MIYGFDAETYLITPGNPVPKGVCLSYAGEDGSKGVMLMEDGLKWFEERLLAGDTLVAHNAPFDVGVCAADCPRLIPLIFQAYAEGRIRDTGIRQKILDNARGELKYEFNEETGEYKAQKFSLAHLCHRILGKWRFGDKEGDVWRLRYYTLDGVPVAQWPKPAYDYSLEDSVDALAIYQKQEEDRFARLLDKEWSQTQADWALGLMSIWGSRTEADDIEELRQQFQDAFDEQVEICQEYELVYRKKEKGVYKWSRKMTVIYELVDGHYQKHGLETPLTDKGKISTARDTLLMRAYPNIEPHPGMVAVSEMVRIGKLLSTYIKMLLLGTEVPINPRYNCIIETFRTSCSKPNIQNLPRDGGVRNCWHARPNYVYGFCDYDTLEMRTLAQVYLWMFDVDTCPLLDAIKANQDLHSAFGAFLLGISYEEIQQRIENDDPVAKETRQGSKCGNYGAAGGMGAEAFVDYALGFGLEITVERARELMRGFRDMWDMDRYFRFCSAVAEEKDPELGVNLVEFFGSGFIRGDVRYTAVCNGYFQHLAAMGAKKALFEVAYACYAKPESPLYGCRPWLFAHDEIGMEIPFDGTDAGRIRASRAMTELERIMIECMRHYCPDVPIGATGALAFRWLKGAKPVFRVINGEKTLVPCQKEGKAWIEDYGEDRMAA